MSQVKAMVDKYLTNASLGLFQDDSRFVAERVLTPVKVVQDSGLIGQYGKEHLRAVSTQMGGRGKAAYFEPGVVSSTSYYVEEYGLVGTVTAADYRNVEKPFDADMDMNMALMQIMKIGRERALAAIMTSSSYITNYDTLSGTSQWSDYNNSDPLANFKTARNSVLDNAGVLPNKVILPYKVFDALRYHPAILENLGFTRQRAGQMTSAEIASALDVQEVIIPTGVYNSSDRGQTDSLAQIWGNHAVFFYAPNAASLRQQSLGFNVFINKGVKVYKNPVFNPPGANDILVNQAWDDVITDANCAYLFSNAIA